MKKYVKNKKNCYRCKMKLTVRLAVVTHDTVRKDKLRKEFPCFITINGNHNHSLSSASALCENKVLPQKRLLKSTLHKVRMS